MTEALETIERARGHLYWYSFHQLTGRAELQLDGAVARLNEIGQADLAHYISCELIGRNVLPGRWSFQVVEEYDDGYYRCFKETEQLVRTRLTDGHRHFHEVAVKQRRRTAGHPAHSRSPSDESAKGESL